MWAIIIAVVLIKITALALYLHGKKKNPEKIFGVYCQPGKWYNLKYLLFFLVLEMRKMKAKFLDSWSSDENGNGDNTMLSSEVMEMEKLQPLSSHKNAFDAVFFQAVTTTGYYMCGGTERRHDAKTFGLFYIVVPGLGLLGSERLPKTILQTDPVSIHLQNTYSAEGICFAPIKPMKTWRVSFNGKMRLESKPESIFNVNLEADWTSNFPYFLYERDMNSRALARAIAQETWSREFFQALKESHQTHYEQMGHLKGTLVVDNEKHDLNMMAFRDHSFGHKRDWALLHRYAFHMIYLSNETRILVGVISHPTTMSHFEVGYIVHTNKHIDTVETCDLKLYQHGERGTPGKDLAFSFIAGKKTYVVKTSVEYEAEHYKGYDGEARLIERFLTYDVNGIKGRGIAEWHYNIVYPHHTTILHIVNKNYLCQFKTTNIESNCY